MATGCCANHLVGIPSRAPQLAKLMSLAPRVGRRVDGGVDFTNGKRRFQPFSRCVGRQLGDNARRGPMQRGSPGGETPGLLTVRWLSTADL